MRDIAKVACAVVLLVAPLLGQGKRLWVLRPAGEMVQYDPITFAVKQRVEVPAESAQSPQSLSVNAQEQILFAPAVSLPLADSDVDSPHKAWFWNGHAAVTIDLGVKREMAAAGSNQVVTETAPAVCLSEDGAHLFWFANQQRRLVREGVDLSVTTTLLAWQTDLAGGAREEVLSAKLPECRCPTGACEESCPYGWFWAPEGGVGKFFITTELVAGKDSPTYKTSTIYRAESGKWTGTALAEPLRRVLESSPDAAVIVEAIPDTGCCGWSNQSNDQTLVRTGGKVQTVFDEQASFKNPDYDVSFSTSNARLSPDMGLVATTIVSTAQANKPFQLAQDGQADPEESQRIRKALAELPVVEVKSIEDPARRVAFVPHAVLVGWIGEKKLLIVENHLLVVYAVGTGARTKSSVRVEDAGRVFLR